MHRQPEPTKGPLGAFATTEGEELLLAAAGFQAAAIKALLRYQIETLSFLKHRIEQDLRFVDDLVESGERGDSFDVMSDFVEIAAVEYASEAEKVVRISAKLASETAGRLRRKAAPTIKDKAARTVG